MTKTSPKLPPLFRNNSDMNGYQVLRQKIDASKTTVEPKTETYEDKQGNIHTRKYTIFTYYDNRGNKLITQHSEDGMNEYEYMGTNGYGTHLEDHDSDGNVDVMLSSDRTGYKVYNLYDDDDNGTFDKQYKSSTGMLNGQFSKYNNKSIFSKWLIGYNFLHRNK